MRILDRYLTREMIPPFILALAVFTFMLDIQPMLPVAEQLLSKNVPLPTVAYLLMLLLPQALGITLPAAYLSGTLMALGRLSADREAVALLACGVSPLRLLRPILMSAAVAAGVTLYVMVALIPDCNQAYREMTFKLFTQKVQSDIKPRLYYEGFPGKMLYFFDGRPDGGWSGVLLADTTHPDHLTFDFAERGRMVVDHAKRRALLILDNATKYSPGDTPGTYTTSRVESESFPISSEDMFGDGTTSLSRGFPEMRIPELLDRIRRAQRAGDPPIAEELYLQQKFSFPAACFVFALLALAIGLHTSKEGRLTGMALGVIVVLVYYALQSVAEGQARAQVLSAAWARWIPILALLVAGVFALRWRIRTTGQGFSFRVPAWIARMAKRDARPSLPAKPYVIIRAPHLSLPRPRLLDLYVSRRYLQLILLTVAGLLSLFYLGAIIDTAQRFFKSPATFAMWMQYLMYQTPRFLYFTIPIATLISVLATFGGLARSSELTVMRACGISLYRVAVPLLLISLVWSTVLFQLEEHVLARTNRKADGLEDIIRGRGPHTDVIGTRNWLADPDGRLFYYQVYDPRHATLHGVNVLTPSPTTSRLVAHTFTPTAIFANGRWTAEGGWTQRFPTPDTSTRETLGVEPIALPPQENFVSSQLATDEMTIGQLRDYISRLSASGFSIAEQRVAFQRRMAFPLVTLVLSILAVPFGLTSGRRGALYGIGIGVGLSMAYWLLETFFVAAGNSALLPPALAAWAANGLFLATAGYLILRVRT